MSKLKLLGTALAAVTPIFVTSGPIGICASLLLGGGSLAATYFGVKDESLKVNRKELALELALNFGTAALAATFAPVSALLGAAGRLVASNVPFIGKTIMAVAARVIPLGVRFPRLAGAAVSIAPAAMRMGEVAAERTVANKAILPLVNWAAKKFQKSPEHQKEQSAENTPKFA